VIAVRVLTALSLLAAAGAAAAGELGSDSQRAAGKALYDKYCAQCHGESGDGVGHATSRLEPRPRDFTSGKYKFRTTPSGMLPTDADLRKAIRDGLPYTSMPGWPAFSDGDVQNLIYHLKTFSEDFKNAEKEAAPIDIPEPPAITEASVAKGRQVYEAQGCAACHGNLGRGDGSSAPTLQDDWGHHIRPADLTMRWTFRGGPTRKDVFRTFSTGLNGTPMPSYFDSLAVADRWDLVNYIHSLGEGDGPSYDNLLLVQPVDDELDLERADELFAPAQVARFPLVGQIMEPGRNFHPATTSIEVQAVYNRSEIAFRLRWNDMRAETAGSNSPAIAVPEAAADEPAAAAGAEEGGDFWGEEAAPADGGGDFWGEAAEPAAEGGDFWGEEAAGEDDFWGEGGAAAPAAAGGEFSDAVALQLPAQLGDGIRKPYFIFGDAGRAVDLWFVDLARGAAEQFLGRGSGDLVPSSTDEIQAVTSYDEGRWTALFKRSLRSSGNVTFQPGQYVPIAFSVWDGFNAERGNKRALSLWFYLYVQPAEQPSAAAPVARAALGALAVELALVFWIRRRFWGGSNES